MTAIRKFIYLFINLTAKKCTKKREKRKCFSHETHCLFDVLVIVALFFFVQLRLVVNFYNSTLLTEFSSWHGFFEIFRVSISLGEVNKGS